LREPRTGLQDVQLGRRLNRPGEIGSPRPKNVRQRQKDPADLFALLFFKSDDVVVDLDGTERFEEQTGAARGRAVNDAWDRGPVFRLHHEHVTAVTLRDDLVLQVLRGLLAA